MLCVEAATLVVLAEDTDRDINDHFVEHYGAECEVAREHKRLSGLSQRLV